MKYYNAETLLEFVKQNTPNIDGETTMECVERAIKEAPTADVVELPCRCRACLNCIKVDDLDNGHWECIAHYDNHGRPYIPDLDGYCSEGRPRERRTDNDL